MSSKNVDKKKKRGSDQLAALINYMSNDPTFAAGKFKDPHNGKRQMDVEWAELAANLNEMGPPKTVEQWKKCWRNEKCMARKVNSAWNKYLSQTGNSSSNKPPEPNDRHQLILSTIGTETSVGIGVGETGFGECSNTVDEGEGDFGGVLMDEETNVAEGIEDLEEIADTVVLNTFGFKDESITFPQLTTPLTPKVKPSPKVDTYKNLVEETNSTLKTMTEAIRENTEQMGSVVHAITSMSDNIAKLTNALTVISAQFANNNAINKGLKDYFVFFWLTA
ncbi:uncharacterized protein LOC100571575 isoform X2 [Acyrthosiphon pisum]|uniref:Regulatory protein zeste n=1 Tax=Acyrthosiphon pisum TaxID=7029 RepID=A0A8R2A846_ACYPI|nr:uncharacterized protein LOC100571575 isoform X2 [Acyrthosiphon pisum]|eukprot:XP_003243190.1 PREDICTED: uncharacterized protein LOC100571575 [Acyrthosiphon pisum]